MKKLQLSLLMLFLVCFDQTFAQKVAINTDGSSPDNSAVLDVKSSSKGMLISRMTSAQRIAISSPAKGLMVFQTDNISGFYYYDNAWKRISTSNAKNPLKLTDSSAVTMSTVGATTGDLKCYDGTNWVNKSLVIQNTGGNQPLDITPPYLGLNFQIALYGIFPSQSMGSSPYIGSIGISAINYEVNTWAFCNGQLLAISEYGTLFQLIGTTYGGDGQSTFALPDLRGRMPVHIGTGAGLSTVQIGETGGSSSVTLTTSQIPAHSHTP